MRIILKSEKTGNFLAENGQWTHDENQARNFYSIADAERFCREQNLPVVAIVHVHGLSYCLHLDCEKKDVMQEKFSS